MVKVIDFCGWVTKGILAYTLVSWSLWGKPAAMAEDTQAVHREGLCWEELKPPASSQQ